MKKGKNKIKIQHLIPGRIRFKVPCIRYDKDASGRIEAFFKKTNGIYQAGTNPKSASLVLRYDQSILKGTDIIQMVRGFFDQQEVPLLKKNIINNPAEGKLEQHPLRSALRWFIGISTLVAIIFVRKVVFGKTSAQKLLSPLGLITAVLALPLVKQGYQRLKEGRLTLETFLGGSIIIAVVAGEAMAALEILWITSGGTLLQAWITERSRKAIKDILKVTEKSAYILVDGVEVEIPVDKLQPGDIVVGHTGEKISVDGKIVKGEALVDESPISGRAEPVIRRSKHKVYAGTFIRQGVIFIRAQKVGDKTYLAHILHMVEESLENKAPIEGIADRLASLLIKCGFAATITTLILTRSLWRAFSVMLVMACPCATILSASTAISAAISAAAARHILIKGGRYLEEVGDADVICFDKTGTLTTNEPEIRELICFNGVPEHKLLQLAYSTELHNVHPLALAVKTRADRDGIDPISHDVCEYFPGKGVRSEIHGKEILVGSNKLMDQFSVNPKLVRKHLNKFKKQGLTLVFVAENKELIGIMGFAFQDRADIVEVVQYLRDDGIKKIAMITGDSKYTAIDMAQKLNFDECYYSIMPEEKSDFVSGLRDNEDKVIMVGDGINDALALAEADIGIAMGAGGSEVAVEAADIALVKDDLKGIVYVRSLSHETKKIIHQNFWIATGSNIVGVAMGAMGILSPVMAGLIHITHTLGILANSSRLLFYEQPPLDSKKG